jgi:hypothetical protein
MARFTSANAREMAARSLAARQAARIQRDAPPVPTAVQASSKGEISLGIDASRVRMRLETLDSLMSKAKTDREWDNLSRAYDRMFRVWCVLTQTPGPGNRRPAPERTRPNWMPPPLPMSLEPRDAPQEHLSGASPSCGNGTRSQWDSSPA